MVEDDRLIQEYRKRNADYEVTPAAGSWEKLEGELLPSTPRYLFPFWLYAAAVVFMLLLSVSAYYLLDGKPQKQLDLVESLPLAGTLEKRAIPAKEPVTGPLVVEKAVQLLDTDRRTGESNRPLMDLPLSRYSCIINIPKRVVVPDLKPIRRYPNRSFFNTFVTDRTENVAGKIIRKRMDNGWSLGFFGGNMMNKSVSGSEGLGMFNFAKVEIEANPEVLPGSSNIDNTGGSLDDFRNDLLSNVPHFSTKSDYQAFEEVALRNFMVPTQTRIRHKFPVSAGLTVRKSLSERFYLESGLTYTSLSSELIAGEGSYYKQEQHLYYLGIPLKAGYTLWKKERFSLYASAGGMMEFCVKSLLSTDYYVDNIKTHQGSTDLGLHKIQYSITASLGAQYEMIKALSLYAEPGISYYFEDGSELVTIRKEHSLNMLLHFGLRLSF